jgi:hypothetical protein
MAFGHGGRRATEGKRINVGDEDAVLIQAEPMKP